MDATSCDVASSGWHSWHHIEWAGAHQTVGRLQARIAKAARNGEWRKVRRLQRLLTASTSAKARSRPTEWCTSRESWSGWTRAQLTTAGSRAG